MSLVTTDTIAELLSRDYDTLSRTFGVIGVALFIGLLLQRELLRVGDEQRFRLGERMLGALLAPLFLVFAFIIIARLITLLFP